MIVGVFSSSAGLDHSAVLIGCTSTRVSVSRLNRARTGMDTTRRALECQEKSFLACKSCFRACFAAHHAFGVLVSGM